MFLSIVLLLHTTTVMFLATATTRAFQQHYSFRAVRATTALGFFPQEQTRRQTKTTITARTSSSPSPSPSPSPLSSLSHLVENRQRHLVVALKDTVKSDVEQEVDPGKVQGTDLTVVKYPHPSLRRHNAEVTMKELEDGSIAQLAKEMLLVMYAAKGVGLAAPQVGVNKRLMVYNEEGNPKNWLSEVVLVNPKIVEFSQATATEIEACLSFPGMQGPVERSKWIKVEALNLRGKPIKKKFRDWEARIFQHEYDHLDGKVYIDRLLPEARETVQPRLNELIQEYTIATAQDNHHQKDGNSGAPAL